MKIQTSTFEPFLNIIQIEPGENIILQFSPLGANAPIGNSQTVDLNISTILLGDRVALAITSTSPLYQNKTGEARGPLESHIWSRFFVVDDPNGADVLEFKEQCLRLERVERDAAE